jgi:Fe-S cluster assembly ATPase SufC
MPANEMLKVIRENQIIKIDRKFLSRSFERRIFWWRETNEIFQMAMLEPKLDS